MQIAGSIITSLFAFAFLALLEIPLQAVIDQQPHLDQLKLFSLATLHLVEPMQFVQKTEVLHRAHVSKTILGIPT
jgi:hypothetical protein